MQAKPVLSILFVLVAGSLLISAPRTEAQGRNGTQVRSLITALNSADSAKVQADLAPNFTLTLADGTTASGAGAVQALLGLPLPISIVSLTPQGNHVVSGMLQFGAGNPIAVTFGGNGRGMVATVKVTQPIGAAPTPSATSGATAATVPVTAGWNLIAGPMGLTVPDASGPLYTYQAGDTAYDAVSSGSPLQAGDGYWAFFTAPAMLTLPSATAQPLERPLPAEQWVMIGNPYTTDASVAGADVVYTYSASSGYQAATTLAPGQGAWAFSAAGGTLTITAAP